MTEQQPSMPRAGDLVAVDSSWTVHAQRHSTSRGVVRDVPVVGQHVHGLIGGDLGAPVDLVILYRRDVVPVVAVQLARAGGLDAISTSSTRRVAEFAELARAAYAGALRSPDGDPWETVVRAIVDGLHSR